MDNYDLAQEKLNTLERALILETNPAIKFALEHEIIELKQSILNYQEPIEKHGMQIEKPSDQFIQTPVGKFTQVINKSPILLLTAVGITVVALLVFFAQGNSPKINIINPQMTNPQFATGNIINDIKIYPDDSPEIRQKKIEKAKHLIANEVLFNITNLDARLGFVEHSLSLNNSDDFSDFEERLRKARQQVTPAMETVAKAGYEKLMSQQQATSLRTTFNSYPLRTDLEAALIQVLVDGNLNPDRVNAFYKSLREAQYQSEALLETMADTALTSSESEERIAYQKRKLSFAINMLKNRSELAYLSAWVVLNSLEISIPELNDKIAALRFLKPNRILSNTEISQLRQEYLAESTQLLSERYILIAEAKKLAESILTRFEALEERLKIQPTDNWSQVSGKARTLRQFGRTTDAIAAFYQYGEMFSDKDPGAKQYAKVAQAFTMQIATLKVEAGLYIYEGSKSSIAEKAGFKVGDIIVDYNGKVMKEMDNLITSLRDSQKEELVKITFLRLNDDSSFTRETRTVTGGMIGIGFMPI